LVVQYKDEEGQAIVIVAVAMSIFLIGAAGLVIDGANLYSQRQMAQTAADAAAESGMMSIFDGTNGTGAAAFSTGSTITCTTADAETPCVYARQNGFGGSASDTVTIDFPDKSTVSGVSFATTYPTVLIRATVQRNVSTTLMRFVGAGSTTTVSATAMAAIVSVTAPVPILVVHPTKSGSLHTNGGVDVSITGGPSRSIEVNSNSTTAVTTAGSGTIDLSLAGPSGNGADFGVWGGPSSAPFTFVPGTLPGRYLPRASWMQDPLAAVAAPPVPTNTGPMGTHVALANGVSGCPASPKKGCQLYYPGLYTAGIDGKNSTPVFVPGIYYIQSNAGIACASNCDMVMATGFTDTGANTTGTGWTGNVLFYNTGSTSKPTTTGPINLGSNGSVNLVGSPNSSTYKGILFFQDRAADAQTHSLGGGGAMTLVGTIYLTNTRSTILGSSTHFQELDLQGNPGSATNIDGEIIVDVLGLGGNAGITMSLSSTPTLIISEVAMIN
jgi:Putative Flp pilus-assembly TadE/G-like